MIKIILEKSLNYLYKGGEMTTVTLLFLFVFSYFSLFILILLYLFFSLYSYFGTHITFYTTIAGDNELMLLVLVTGF